MTGSNQFDRFSQYAELEEQLRAALNANVVVGPELTKTAIKKLAKEARRRPKAVHMPLQRAHARIVVAARKKWGGNVVHVEYNHTNCSMFEAELKINRMLEADQLVFHALIQKEVVHQSLSPTA